MIATVLAVIAIGYAVGWAVDRVAMSPTPETDDRDLADVMRGLPGVYAVMDRDELISEVAKLRREIRRCNHEIERLRRNRGAP